MRIAEVMSENIQACSPSDAVVNAAKKMKDFNIGSIPIVDDNNVVKGILTDRDIIIRGVALDKDLSSTTCQELMTTDLISCLADTDVHEAAEMMSENQIRRLPVTDGQNHLVGICAIADLAVKNIFINDAGKALSDISKPQPQFH